MCVCVCVCVLSRFSLVRFFATTWTVAQQAPLSLGFSRQEYWRGAIKSCVCVCVCVCKIMYVCVKSCVCVCVQSCLFATLWTITFQAPLFIGFSRQEYWSGMPFLLNSKHILRKPVPTSLNCIFKHRLNIKPTTSDKSSTNTGTYTLSNTLTTNYNNITGSTNSILISMEGVE